MWGRDEHFPLSYFRIGIASFHSGNSRRNSFYPDGRAALSVDRGASGVFRAGTLRLRINLCEVEFKAGDLLAVSPGTVFEFLYVSPDLDLAMLAFSNSLMENWQKEDLLQTYLQGRLFLHLSLTAKEVQRMEQLFALLWEVVHDRPFSESFRAESDFSVLSSTGFCQEKQSIY